jgi:2-hydroxychromene-2-carboxylate isomerase
VSVIVYADFSSPDGYLASRRADILAAAGVAVDWRAVECAPGLPVAGRRLSTPDQDAVAERFRALDSLLVPGERLPWTMPQLTPKTEAAVSACAEAYGTTAYHDVRRLLYELYWRDGADIGSPTVVRAGLAGPILRAGADAEPLRRSGYAVSVDRGPITAGGYARIRAWRGEWLALGGPALAVVLADGTTLSGDDALQRLAKEIAYVDADVDPQLGDPRRYPHVEGRPSASWVSQIGGRWRNIYRLDSAR